MRPRKIRLSKQNDLISGTRCDTETRRHRGGISSLPGLSDEFRGSFLNYSEAIERAKAPRAHVGGFRASYFSLALRQNSFMLMRPGRQVCGLLLSMYSLSRIFRHPSYKVRISLVSFLYGYLVKMLAYKVNLLCRSFMTYFINAKYRESTYVIFCTSWVNDISVSSSILDLFSPTEEIDLADASWGEIVPNLGKDHCSVGHC